MLPFYPYSTIAPQSTRQTSCFSDIFKGDKKQINLK